MIRYFRDHLAIASALAVAASLACADTVHAGSLRFRNDTTGPVIVQAMSVIQGRVVAGTRHVLQPGVVSSDLVVRPGKKLIIIVDAKRPTQTLYVGDVAFPAAGLNKLYSIQPADPPQAKNKPAPGAAAPRVKLVEVQLPVNPMPGTVPGMPRR